MTHVESYCRSWSRSTPSKAKVRQEPSGHLAGPPAPPAYGAGGSRAEAYGECVTATTGC
jgi:hypothetical protein